MDAISYSRALKPQPAERPDGYDEHDVHEENVWGFRSIIAVIVRRSSSPEVWHVHSRSLEASRSRVGIAERDDILWFRCIFGASRKGPLRPRCDHRTALIGESGCCASGATT
jgi:hypothetical protein